MIALGAGAPEPAAELAARAVAAAPDVAAYHVTLAQAYRATARAAEAVASARRAVELAPESNDALVELATSLGAARQVDDAEQVARRAVERRPDDADALTAHANALADVNRFDEAIAVYEAAARLRPDDPIILSNFGQALARVGRYDDGEPYLRRAIELAPEDADSHFNLSLILLARGQLSDGWREYEWRWRRTGAAPMPRSAKRPLWDGAPLDGRTILLHTEQGHGDAIQFVRYASLLRAGAAGGAGDGRGAGRVTVMCERPLVELMRTAEGVDEVVPKEKGVRQPPFDVHCPLASLPGRFGTTLETIPNRVPYVSADPHRRARWRETLNLTRDVRNVGLVWRGSVVHANDRNRSCRLADLAPLAAVPGVRFVSLQLGPGREGLAAAPRGFNIADAADGIQSFADAAALLAELDLLVSVDTAPAHLAGALARPVWTIHSFAADFRWLLNRSDSPWYPTMRLFRQPRMGDWAAVVAEVAGALARFARGGSD